MFGKTPISFEKTHDGDGKPRDGIALMNALVKARDFFDHMQKESGSFRLLASNIGGDEAVLRGRFQKTQIRQGLTMHYSDVTNLCDLSTETEAPPHLGIKLFFQGGVSASIGNQDIPMPCRQSGSSRWSPSATLFHQSEREVFRRQAAIGDRVRKLTIKVFPEWLESGDVLGGTGAEALRQFTSSSLAARSWSPSAALVSLAEQAISPQAFEPYLARLYMESRVLQIIAEAFSQLRGGHAEPARPSLNAIERQRLQRAEELLANEGASPSVDVIASEVGVSVNTLQRLFHTAYDTTVFHYVRTLKLKEARQALEAGNLTIAQAAFVAGYSSPANFATAFKRAYGFSPKDARSR